MATLLFEFRNAADTPTRDDVKKQFGFADHEIEGDIMPVSGPTTGKTFVAVVDKMAAAKVEIKGHRDFVRNYANPGLE